MSTYTDKTDIRRPIMTPEGGVLSVRVAGPVVRSIAWTIDLVLRMLFYFLVAMVVGIAFPEGLGALIFSLVLFAGEWLYFALFEWLKGATPGKKQCGLVVVERDGSPCGLEASFVRNIVRFVDFLPPVYGFGLISMFFSADFQRLGDRAAGTLVIHGKPKQRRKVTGRQSRDDYRDPDDYRYVEPVPLTIALTGEEEAAILEFARRAPNWGYERSNELADYAEPLTGLTGDAGRKRLLQHANWLDARGR